MIQCMYCGHFGGSHSPSCHRPVSVALTDTAYDWPPDALARLRAAVLAHAGLPRHSFGRRFADWPSLQPERIPAHRAPKHRNDRPEDSCSLVCEAAYEGAGNCTTYVGRHRAGEAA